MRHQSSGTQKYTLIEEQGDFPEMERAGERPRNSHVTLITATKTPLLRQDTHD